MKYITFIYLFLLFSSQLKAQTLDDPIYLNYSFFPSANIGNSEESMKIKSIEAQIAAPIINISKNIKLINTLYYRNSQFDFNSGNTEENQSFANSLHDIRYSAILRAKVSKRFEILSISRILLRSDLQENLQSHDLFPFVLVLGNYAIKGNPNFTVGLGVALNNDFSHNAIIPVAALRYESEKVKLEVVYPNFNLLYKKSSSLEFGLFANVDGSISRMANTTDENVHFQRNFQVLVAPTVSFRIYKQIFGHFKAGIVPINNFQLLDNNHEEIKTYTRELDPSFFFRTGISFRLKK